MNCLCGSVPCKVLPINGGADWFYKVTRNMNYGERAYFRANHADPRETRSLTLMLVIATQILYTQKPELRPHSSVG